MVLSGQLKFRPLNTPLSNNVGAHSENCCKLYGKNQTPKITHNQKTSTESLQPKPQPSHRNNRSNRRQLFRKTKRGGNMQSNVWI